ncbi:MAG TPA: MtnX-like HAD-IB family phosphatase [Spirochaetota bacterium]|nr:MtnX-like HAD-IB family phosphatase [Spirochaetota bacterium]HPN82856.1 MtnX-like HAD-IB family phosphatase [Spirochaetota bacterium]
MRPIVFCDFDGTIITRDSCVELTARWSRNPDWQSLEARWQNGELSTAEVAQTILDSISIPLVTILDELQSIPVRSGFLRFAEFCTSQGLPLIVVSDGYEVIIRRTLAAARLDLPVYANVLYQDGQKLVADHPHASPDCALCGCCKRSIISRIRGSSGRPVILIGDGRSDLCPARVADQVFGCGRLPELCRESGIDCIRFEDFTEILEHPALVSP